LDDKAPGAFRTISEVADELDLPQHVLRFWESRFAEIKPMKRGGGRRYYRPDDIELLRGIRHLLYGEGYTIRGVQRILREQGVDFVQSIWQEGEQAAVTAGGEDEADVAEETVEADDDEEAEELEESDEPRGIRGRIGSLIGRDLNERDTRADRTEPPLREAPTPRIDAGDRFGNASRGGPEQYAPPPRPAPKPAAVSAPVGLSGEQSARLQHVLDDLRECRKVIEAALTPADRQ
jgi:DNA-binding transcriptional MerR regulator